jgi:hypothetical protein
MLLEELLLPSQCAAFRQRTETAGSRYEYCGVLEPRPDLPNVVREPVKLGLPLLKASLRVAMQLKYLDSGWAANHSLTSTSIVVVDYNHPINRS